MNIMHKPIVSITLSIIISFFVTTQIAFAKEVINFSPESLDKTHLLEDIDIAEKVALGTNDPILVVLRLMNVGLTLLGSLCVILLIYGGFLWVWARGDSEQIQKAKDILQGTIIGLVIVLASLGITQYVFTQVADITGAQTSSIETPV